MPCSWSAADAKPEDFHVVAHGSVLALKKRHSECHEESEETSRWDTRTQTSGIVFYHEIVKDIVSSLNETEHPRVLMLGLGGGALAGEVLCHTPVIESFTSVELLQPVIDIARAHFLPLIFNGSCAAAQSKLRIVQGDAFKVAELFATKAPLFTHTYIGIDPLAAADCYDGPPGWYEDLASVSALNARLYVNVGIDTPAEIRCARATMRRMLDAGWSDTRLLISKNNWRNDDSNVAVVGRLVARVGCGAGARVSQCLTSTDSLPIWLLLLGCFCIVAQLCRCKSRWCHRSEYRHVLPEPKEADPGVY